MIVLQHRGKLTAGYYNDMEAVNPIFIDGDSLSNVVKELLRQQGLNDDFCYQPFGSAEDVDNHLIGKRVRLTLKISD